MSALLAAGITAGAGLLGAGLSMMNKGSQGQYGTTTQSQIPMGVSQRDADNWDLAVQTANQLMGPYQGQRVAGMTPEMQNLIGQLYGNVGSTNPAFNAASATTNGLMGFNPSMVTPQTLAGTNLAPYMNPYTGAVINPTMTLMDQSLAQQQNQTAANARTAGAFGGSRQGVQQGVNDAQTNLLKGQFAGNLLNANFNQAQTAATGDITRNLTAQQLNQQAGEWGAQFRGSMANQLGNLATAGQNAWLTGVQQAMGGQQMLTAQQQAQLDAQRQLYMEQRQQPLDVLQIRQNALSNSPYGQTSYQQGPGPSTNPYATGFGMAATTAGILGQMGAWNKPTTSPNTYSYPSPAQQSMYPELGPSPMSPGYYPQS
jgi:hypothetical protein